MTRFYFSTCFVILFSAGLAAQNLAGNFRRLSRPEKHWAMAHPFIAKKAFHCAQRARFVTDSLEKNGILKDGNGGQLDAYRHTYWMALLVQKIPARKAEKLGKAHEKGNELGWKKGEVEDGARVDSMMCVMDLENNLSGITIGKNFKTDTAKISLEEKVLQAVKTGKLKIIKKDEKGNWLDASGRMIILSDYKDKWYIPKVLVRSDYFQARADAN